MQVIPIFFSANDNYVPVMSVMIRSIMENADPSATLRKYEIIILHRDISLDSMKKTREMVAEFPAFSVDFHEMVLENIDFFVSRHITVESYFRLFIPYRFPQYEKALYFDGDMICKIDVSELFEMDMSNYLIGGVRDIAVAWYFLPEKKEKRAWRKTYEYMLSMENPADYINGGMLLINSEKIRQTYSEKDIVDIIFSREWQVHDQDIINFLAKNKILHLGYEWDFIPRWRWAKYLPQDLKDNYIEAQKKPKIIHYKPYSCWWCVPHFEAFWKYATRTPFTEDIINKMDKHGLLNEDFTDIVKTRIGWKTMLKTMIQEKLFKFLRK
ncbi:MAG: glycosyltransferase family 8 protein [Chitinispirillales bacterium]|jgi:lipopolysaccharide biosynthesis glycosyltransferase|nr:glycosyltransferase family 8 protein [Chitinispirillales bacterium]